MKKKTVTRSVLLTSILSLLLCVAMLLGTTYAWFSDSVTSTGNIIKTGKLDIDLLVKGGNTTYTSYTSVKTSEAPIFNYNRWEPGYTSWVNAKVTTTGNLALKYTMRITVVGALDNLADVIDVYYAPEEKTITTHGGYTREQELLANGLVKKGTLRQLLSANGTDQTVNGTLIPDTSLYNGTAVTASGFATIALHMRESAGNEYQNRQIGTSFSLQLLATQYEYESDSFDNQYDHGLGYAGLPPFYINSSTIVVHFPTNTTSSEGGGILIPANTAVTTDDEALNSALANLQVDGTLTRFIRTTMGSNSATYDISFEYSSAAGTATVTSFSNIVTNVLDIGAGLTGVSVTHSKNGTEITPFAALTSADQDAEGFYYDPSTGLLIIKSKTYSDFTVTYTGAKVGMDFEYDPADSTRMTGLGDYINEKVVNIPEGVKTIGSNVFVGNTHVESIILSSTVETIEFGVNADQAIISPFNGCTGLKRIDMSKSKVNTIVHTTPYGGTLGMFSAENVLSGATNTFEEIILPATAGIINDFSKEGLFWGQINLKSIVVPNGVTTIGKSVFRDCKKLETIYLPASITKIEARAFQIDPSKLTTVYYGGSEEQWKAIKINNPSPGYNNPIINAQKVYNYTGQ